MLLRHKLPNADLETGVFWVLVTVARAVREGRVQDENQLLAEVRAAANSFIKQARAAIGVELVVPPEEIRRALQQLKGKEQEILVRFYHMGQTEEQISREMRVPAETIRKVKKIASNRFLVRK